MVGPTDRVCAVVVTRDRRELLERCLGALRAQTRPVDAILLVDNASSDGTPEWVASAFPEVELLHLRENVGGAGGFHAGMKAAAARPFDWLWLMDDDTLAEPTALEALLAGGEKSRAFGDPVVLASKVVWEDGRRHPMNIPGVDVRRWEELLEGPEIEVLPLRSASFVSVLIRRDAVLEHGLPLREYFIWFDDVEYTSRLLRKGVGAYVPASVARHLTRTAYATVQGTGDRFYYSVRNRIFLLRGPALGRLEKARLARALVRDVRDYVAGNKLTPSVARLLLRATRDGITTPAARLQPEHVEPSVIATASAPG